MRKIEQRMLQAIKNKENWSSDNTAVFFISAQESGTLYGSRSEIYLCGNHIANVWNDGALWVNSFTFALYPTNTIKSRLRALGVNVTTKNGVTYLDGVAV